MKNPLRKRLVRELRHDLGKYIALFLFLIVTIGFVSGFLVADNSMKTAYDNSFDTYNVEDGHFTLANKASDVLLTQLKGQDIEVHELFYIDASIDNDHSIRVFKNRTDVNKACLMDGDMPAKDTDIVIDRLYAKNNSIQIGDTLAVNGEKFTVTGFVALSDYSAMFKNNTDMMFDANHFTIAVVTDKAYDAMGNAKVTYCYAWQNDKRDLSSSDLTEKADSLKDILIATGELTDFVKQADNQAIVFTGEDMGGDKAMMTWLLYVIIVVLAFVFAVTTKNTIEQEASVIGTLRASGYSRAELVRHYLALPTIVTLIAALVGNVLGYSCMKNICVWMYYGSYSLPSYTTLWNADAFILTTVIPCLIILVVNVLVLIRTLALPPLQFLRHDLKRKQKKKVVRLPEWKFLTRFRCRIILQNLPTYLTLFVGIFFASLILIFGMVMNPLLAHFKTDVLDSQIANYQYVLKAPVETKDSNAEKYCVASLNRPDGGEEITVYGITKDSEYLKDLHLGTGSKDVVISEGYGDKYGLEVGDNFTLTEQYKEKEYTFTVGATYDYAASLCVFLPQDSFNDTFGNEEDSFNGYFSNSKLNDIDEMFVASIVTSNDLTVIANQLDDSVGAFFPLICAFAAILYILLMYLLAKLIVEKNAQSISMIKILGYNDREAGRLYNASTAIVVGLSLLITLPLDCLVMKGLYYVFMQELNGWLTFWIAPWIYPAMIGIGVVCYFIVHIIQAKKVNKIPMSQALKNVE